MSLEDKKRRERRENPFNTNVVFEIRKEFIEGKKKELQELKREVQLTELRDKVGTGVQEKQGTGGLDALTVKSKPDAEKQIKQQKQEQASKKSQGQTEQGRASP